MKKLEDFEEELNKCSRCGLCQFSCPVFEVTKNDCCVSKGLFTMLLGVVKNELRLSKVVDKYLDKCLKCDKCTNSCPAGIDACQILNVAIAQYSQESLKGKLARIFFSNTIFSNIIGIFKILSKPFRNKKNTNHNVPNVIYFKGCVNEIFPNTDNNLVKILKTTDINVIEPEFKCCGLPLLSEGCMEQFKKNAFDNIEEIKNESSKIVVTDCASCQSTLKAYEKYLDNFDWEDVQFKNWGEIIAEQNIKFTFPKKIRVTFHRPCHLENDEFFEKIINNCENIEYIKSEGYDDCCGFAGSFSIKNLKLSQKISQKKAKNIIKTNADYVITTCPSCLLGLWQGLILERNFKTKPITLIDFLAKATV